MRILYIASNSDDGEDLYLEREITELQQRLTQSQALPKVEIKFLPALEIEKLATEITNFSPTILHISAHAGKKHICFSNRLGKVISVTASILNALIDVPKPPKLVYLNACDSTKLAESAAKIVPAAIGTTAAISNHDAVVSAVRFYEALLEGSTVDRAFGSAKALLEAVSEKSTSAAIFYKFDEFATYRLIEPFQVIARFGTADEFNFKPDSDGNYYIECGVLGCPDDTTVVSFFSDDESFIRKENENDLLIGIAKGPPIRTRMWEGTSYSYEGDFRVGASGITGGGQAFAAYSTACDALELYFERDGYRHFKLSKKHLEKFRRAVATLRQYDGS
jgi:hypothetical protein